MRIVQQVVESSKIKGDQIKWDLDPISEYLSLELSGQPSLKKLEAK